MKTLIRVATCMHCILIFYKEVIWFHNEKKKINKYKNKNAGISLGRMGGLTEYRLCFEWVNGLEIVV